MGKNGLIIYDLDDTLIDTSHLFWEVRTSLLNKISDSQLNQRLIDRFEEIESDNIKVFGHDPRRYRNSIEKLYNNLLSEGLSPIENIAIFFDKVCNRLVEETPQLIDGALDLLSFTQKSYDHLLITRGIEKYQIMKVNAHRLEYYFEKIVVVSHKTSDTFLMNARKMGAYKNIWVIGDSIKSDINPAIQAGMKPIHFKYNHHSYNWRQEHSQEPIGSYFKIDHLTEVCDLLS